VVEHVALFNTAVRSGDWSAFLATFAEDAVMRFVNVPVGPYIGRDAIAAAYAERPPDDTMTLGTVEERDSQTVRAAFAWDAGGTGTMTVHWRHSQVADLTIAFD
jgi:hypothetical protein